MFLKGYLMVYLIVWLWVYNGMCVVKFGVPSNGLGGWIVLGNNSHIVTSLLNLGIGCTCTMYP